MEPVLRIAVTSRALFDLEVEDRVFHEEGLEAYLALQRRKADVPPRFGTAFPLVRKLLGFNTLTGEDLVEVVLVSRNFGSVGIRIGRAIEAAGLPIWKRAFTGGHDVHPFLKALGVGLFLSADPQDVANAIAHEVPAALVLPSLVRDPGEGEELRVAFDGDCCLFDASAQAVFDAHGLDAFNAHEHASREVPLGRGPMAAFLDALVALQGRGCPIRTAVVTARSAPADQRVLATLQAWGVEVGMLFALGGAPKAPILEAFGADIFFDDSDRHVVPASAVVPSAKILQVPPAPRLDPA